MHDPPNNEFGCNRDPSVRPQCFAPIGLDRALFRGSSTEPALPSRRPGRHNRIWSGAAEACDGLDILLTGDQIEALDPFDRVQLAHVIKTCRTSRSLSDAGRTLFAASRSRRSSSNDADRLHKYLARFDLSLQNLKS